MKRSLIAGMSAAAIATTALVAPQAVHAADPAPVVQSGSVETPIKDSFLGYIQGFAKGEIHVSEGAEKVLNGEKTKAFKLPVNADDTKLDANGNGTIELDGKIQFYGHKGLGANGGWGLDLNFSDIKLKVDGKKMQMLADYVSVGELPGGTGSKNSPADDALIAEYELVAPIKPEAGKEFDFKVNEGRLKDGGFDAFIAYSEQYKPEADAFGGTLKFAEKKKEEPTNTSKPEEPTNTSKPEEPTNTSKPEEPTNTSKPEEPTNTSKPAPNAGSSEKAKTAGIVIGVLAALAAIIGITGFINSGALDSIMRQFR